jgi:DNA-binding MurR/RpiR family transcriptional regulator|tara:strand:- start:1482 stop:2051 length:570 start_codon:yes stop_codon:yes gene_type:complete
MTKKATKTKLTEELKLILKTEFVQGIAHDSGERQHFSIEDLIKKYNVAPATLYRASQSEGWKAQREQYNIELQEKLNSERQKLIAKESIRFDDKLLTKANEVIDQISYYLQMNEEAMNEKTTPIQPNQFLALTNSLLAAQKLGKISMGEITENINVHSTIKEADAFNSIMELLDTVKTERLNSDSDSLH